MNIAIFIILGYLIGSISPGYFLGRLIKNIDIRNYGYRNTGATNTYHQVGSVYGVAAALFDAVKAAFVYYLAVTGLFGLEKVSTDLAILAGLAAATGHVLPFYLNFKGGKGVAALSGLILISVFHTQSPYVLALLIGAVIYSMVISRSRPAMKMPLRKLIKLSAITLPLVFIKFPAAVLQITIFAFFIFAAFDALRLIFPVLNQKYLRIKTVAKRKETKRLSGYTLFTAAALILFRFFSADTAIFVLAAFALSDTFAAFSSVPLFMPQHKIIGDKTLGGLILIFIISIATGIFLNSLTSLILPLNFIIIGALIISILDQFSFVVDDNLLVPVGAALLLAAIF